ncbi:hypothetical protein DRQ09_04115, partial [candidate division KSB1 bacterium]
MYFLLLLFPVRLFAQKQIYIETPLGKAYPVEHSRKDFYCITNFKLDNGNVKINVDSGYVLFGSTIKGVTEAIIIPIRSKVTGLIIDYIKIEGELDDLYLRFNFRWYKNYLSRFLKRSSFINSVYNKAIKIHKQKFRNYYHAGWYAIIPPEKTLMCEFSLKTSGLRIGSNFLNNSFFVFSGLSNLWNKFKDGKFTIYYPENSVIKDSLQKWLDIRKTAFKRICNYLRVSEKKINNITFYVFNNKKQGLLYGERLGYAIPDKFEIYTAYDQTPGHKLTHIVSYWINKKRINSALINEGLAVYLDQTGRNYSRISKYLISSGIVKDKNLKNLLGNNFRKEKYGYILA